MSLGRKKSSTSSSGAAGKRKKASNPSSSTMKKKSKPSDESGIPDFMRHLPLTGDVRPEDDEEILSDDPDVDGANYKEGEQEEQREREEEDEDEGLGETAEEKRLRLAKAYLEEIEREEKEREGDREVHNLVNLRLRRDVDIDAGKLKEELANRYSAPDAEALVRLRDHRCHKESVTCVVVSPCGKFVFSGSEDAGIVKWSLTRSSSKEEDKIEVSRIGRIIGGKRKEADTFEGHCKRINALAISSDGKFLAAGDDTKNLRIWDPVSLTLLKTFRGHRDSITGLAFRRKTHSLFSASADRTIKVWNLDEMAYVETLHGHQDRITGIDSGVRERCISSGGRDSSVRIFKVVEESQLVFNASQASTDAVKLINEEHFVTAGEDGHISLWGTMKKKPLSTIKSAHGCDDINEAPRWISALAPMPMSDLIATGSCDGTIRFWRCSNSFRSLEPLPHLNVTLSGFVNALAFTPDGRALVAAVGRSHRLGGWWRIKDKEVKNSVVVIPLKLNEEDFEKKSGDEEEDMEQ